MSNSATALQSKLEELGIPLVFTKEHEPVMTVDEMVKHLDGIEGERAKNLFLKDKKKHYYLLTADINSKTDLSSIGKLISAKDLRFVDGKKMTEMLGVPLGSVTPFALMNESAEGVKFVLDSKLASSDVVCVHPNRNTATVGVNGANLVKFAEATGHEVVTIDLPENGSEPAAAAAAAEAPKAPVKKDAVKAAKKAPKEKKEKVDEKGVNKEGIDAKKMEDFSKWYTQVITRGGFIRYHDISGCYILRPPVMFIWEKIQDTFNAAIRKLGVRPCCFPMFVSKSALEREKEHVEGFSPEVAWVTKAGDSDLPEPIAIRPTSETIMYPSYADWIRSYRDLPLKLNQWTNVVRWEFKQPTPFIRTREFLWQEGHTAHATKEEAIDLVYKILDLYKMLYEELLAVPVVQGVKSEMEKFAGGEATTTCEAFVACNGRAVQGATSHFLGTHFAKMFGIEFEDRDGSKKFAEQTSWGFTTRSIGVMIMEHGDDKGLVLPPRVAETQVVIVPIPPKGAGAQWSNAELKTMIAEKCKSLYEDLDSNGVRVILDDRDDKTPGYKFNHWELRGVPLRIEVGAKDLEKGVVTFVRRNSGRKSQEGKHTHVEVKEALEAIQSELLEAARGKLHDGIVKVTNWDDVMPSLNNRKLILAPWCETEESEEQIKKITAEQSKEQVVITDEEGGAPALSGAMKSLCIPLESSGYQLPMPEGTKCFFTGKPAKRLGVKPCYFPLFVSDQPHPSEVSSATFLPGKVTSAGESTLNEPVALRESGNSVAWKCLSEWIRSHRDLPMKVHYWGSSIRFNSRWRHIPFLKCREVLQQEGFAVHRSLDESAEFCDALSKIYRRACEDLLALPSREAYDGEQRFLEVPMLNNDQRIRFLTISCNGVDDSLPYEDSDGHRKPAHVVTWRMDFSIIGAMVMVHGDNRGLSIPPSVSEIQVVVIPIPPPRGIGSALFEERMKAIEQRCEELVTLLNERSIRCIIDDDPKKRPGFKLTRWNLRGVPLIIQIGWKEVETNTITVVRRHNNEKLHNEPSNADTICRHLSRVNDEMLLSARQST
ncbi:hypothetical protein FOL47_005806 [Perkinsus chesapeaki]|uniref:proline--tRNA ligase n=1 Tax=Perkinsus chesapeaki TaxID=330153 RepID=A0A7J6LVN4_PERCH|nr:hypothetical protein FOL47_005806 [Perkinsus chesapeaki]